jgi:hypothetical protein
MTQMAWRSIWFVVALNAPLHRNLLYGQYYLLLLFVMVASCWYYLRGGRLTSGVLIGLGFGLKIFPVLVSLYFVRKRDVKALAGGCIGAIIVAISSVMAFGVELNRLYVSQVLPWAVRGEGVNPYNAATASFAVALHRLFIYEPQWNPYPLWHAPWLFAVLHPILQTLILVPVMLLVSRRVRGPKHTKLEWAGVVVATVTVSTWSASYMFTLLILPVCLLWEELKRERKYWLAVTLFALYLVVGVQARYPGGAGWLALVGLVRLYGLIGLCIICCYLLWRHMEPARRFGWDEVRWLVAIGVVLVLDIVGGLHHQHDLYADYAARLPMPPDALMVGIPAIGRDTISFVAMSREGYRAGVYRGGVATLDQSTVDELGVSAVGNERWTEEAGSESNIVFANSGRVEVTGAETPMVTSDGTRMAFLREVGGQGRLWIHEIGRPDIKDRPVTSAGVNVLEMSFLGNDKLVVSADIGGNWPHLYTADMNGKIELLSGELARYPSVSPDGKWLAYSRLDRGYWNLWIREIGGGRTVRVTNAECNTMEPTWEKDSATLVYASDCGRALWFTALCERRVLPLRNP